MPTTAHASDPALMHTDAWLEGCPGNPTWRRRGERTTAKGGSLVPTHIQLKEHHRSEEDSRSMKKCLEGGSRGQSLTRRAEGGILEQDPRLHL